MTEGAEELVEALRLLERAGLVDYNGHVSRRLGDVGFAINSAASNRAAPRPADITRMDAAGLVQAGLPAGPRESWLHQGIYAARADVGAIVHGHSAAATTLTIAGLHYAPNYAQGALLGAVPLFPDVASISTPDLGDALAATLGSGRAALLQSHGFVVCGSSLVEAVVLALYLEENARRQLAAMASAGRCRAMTEGEIAAAEALRDAKLFAKAYDYFRAKAAQTSEAT